MLLARGQQLRKMRSYTHPGCLVPGGRVEVRVVPHRGTGLQIRDVGGYAHPRGGRPWRPRRLPPGRRLVSLGRRSTCRAEFSQGCCARSGLAGRTASHRRRARPQETLLTSISQRGGWLSLISLQNLSRLARLPSRPTMVSTPSLLRIAKVATAPRLRGSTSIRARYRIVICLTSRPVRSAPSLQAHLHKQALTVW